VRPNSVRLAVPLAAVALAGVVSITASRPPAVQHAAARQGHLSFEAAPDQAYLDERLGTGNHPLTQDAFTTIGQEALNIRAQTAASDLSDAMQQWQFQGPTNIDNPHPGNSDGGGRVPDVAVDPRAGHGGTVYIATASGGIWKTTDGGAHITSVWPISNPQAIGAIAVGPDGTVFAGTGETNPGGGSITFYGDGIYRSTNGGASWTNIGLTDSWTIGRIVIDPRSSATGTYKVWVAASGNLFLSGHQRGVYVTTNGLANTGGTDDGVLWTQSLAPPNATTGAVDLAMSQQHQDTIYAALWDHQRTPNSWAYTGVGSSVWKTTNGGTSWTDLTSAANTATDHLIADGNADVGRIGVAVAPSNDSDVYVNYANETEGVQVAFFTSTDGGSTFTEDAQTSATLASNITAASYVYGWWFAKVFVDPANPQHLFITSLCLWESTDGANSVNSDCNVHADQHAMAWDPNLSHTVYLGDDGGFYRSTNNGAIGSYVPATNEPWTQFDGLDVSEQNPARIIGGLQDNGSQRNWDKNGNPTGLTGWNSVFGGDGQQNLIDPANQNIVFSCLQYGVCQVSTDGGNCNPSSDCSEIDTTPLSLNQNCNTCTHTTRNAYFTPMAFDPANPSIVYYGGDEMNESKDDGSTWNLISSNLGGPSTGSNTDPLYAGHFGAATTIAVSQSNDNIVWIGTDSGCLWYTQNALADNSTVAWTDVSGSCGPSATPPASTPLTTALPTQFVSKILIDPTNPQVVFVGFSGYRSGDNAAYVERTNDGGAHWTNLSSNLPEVTVNSLALAGGRLYAANDTGVYVSAPGSSVLSGPAFNWDQLGNNLPAAPASMLRFVPENGTLYVSTFGRGVWSLAITGPQARVPEAPLPLVLPLAGSAIGVGLLALRRRKRAL